MALVSGVGKVFCYMLESGGKMRLLGQVDHLAAVEYTNVEDGFD